jgi:hypothetical protein
MLFLSGEVRAAVTTGNRRTQGRERDQCVTEQANNDLHVVSNLLQNAQNGKRKRNNEVMQSLSMG